MVHLFIISVTSSTADNKENTSIKNYHVQYAPKTRTKNRLEFLHIAKNGGTSIENSAAIGNMRWGKCHFVLCLGFCYYNTCSQVDRKNRYFLRPDLEGHPQSAWHIPIQELPSNPYGEDAALFVVVRNPYERVISEYYYYGSSDLIMDSLKMNHKDSLNDWVAKKLKKSNHILPSYNYIFDHNTGKQVVDYVLRLETLQEDFDQLMKEFSLNVQLRKDNTRHRSASLTIDDLSDESLQRINEYFYDDFFAFGYEMKKAKESKINFLY